MPPGRIPDNLITKTKDESWAGTYPIRIVRLDVKGEAVSEQASGAGGPEGARRWLGQNGARAAVVAWLKIRGDDPGPLFLTVNKSGRWEREE